jgi:TrmH family RNA methyltransferase
MWLKGAEQIRIPMLGRIDSLNVSTSCAIIVFEAVRKRKV